MKSQEMGALEDAPAYIIYRLSRLLRHNLRKILTTNGLDISPEQYFILYKLFLKDGVSQADLADAAFGDFPNMTRILDGLEKKKLIRRQKDPKDRRRYLIRLTEKGTLSMENLKQPILKEREKLFGTFGEDEMETLLSSLNRLQAVLDH